MTQLAEPAQAALVSLNLNIRGMDKSATLAINERCRKLRDDGHDIIHFGFGQSPFTVPESVVEQLRRYADRKEYLPVQGLEALRHQVAEYHNRAEGIDATADDVMIGPGSKELMFLLQLVFYGEIVVSTPCWVSYGPQARILGRPLKRIHTEYANQWRLTAAQLDDYCRRQDDDGRPRLLVMNYPSNPCGITYKPSQLIELADVCRQHGVLVMSDEIYGGVHFEGNHVSLARFYPQGTIISSGLSKWCGAGGWRLGTFTFPKQLSWLRQAMCTAASETYTSVCTPVQYAAVQAFTNSTEIDRYLAHSRRILKKVGLRTASMLAEAGFRVHDPEGGFYVYCDFEKFRPLLERRNIHNSTQLCQTLLEESGVALLPAADFERPTEELAVRLAFVDFDGATAMQASIDVGLDKQLDDTFVYQHCSRVIRGIERMIQWVKQL